MLDESNFDLYMSREKDFWYVRGRGELLGGLLWRFGKVYGRVLDAGCGTGFNVGALRGFGRVLGVDVNKGAIGFCRDNFLGCDFLVGDLNNFVCDERFDAVVFMDVLEHLSEPKKVLSGLSGNVVRGGLLVVTVPAFRCLWGVDDVLAHHVKRYGKSDLLGVVPEGFVVRYVGFRYFFHFIPSVVLFQLQKLLPKRKNSLSFTPRFINSFLLWLMRLENYLILRGFRFPFGVGLVLVAEKE